MANYTKNDKDVQLLNQNQRIDYQFEFLKHDVHENLDINKTVQGIEYLRKSQDKGFKEMMVEKDEEAGEKYRISDKVLMIMMMCTVVAVIILLLVYIALQFYKIVVKIKMRHFNFDGEDNTGLLKAMEEKLQFIFVMGLAFILMIVLLLIANKGFYYLINYVKMTRKFLHRI